MNLEVVENMCSKYIADTHERISFLEFYEDHLQDKSGKWLAADEVWNYRGEGLNY